jgi:ferredoxin-NADP reductase
LGIGIHTLNFDGSEEVGAGAVALRFRARRPVGHRAGQHAFWHIPGGGIAPFTIASAPEESHVVLATNAGAHSRLKRALGALEPGVRVVLAGPLASFTLEGAGREVVMLAQGIGVTPFRAMLTHIAVTELDVVATLVHVGAAQGTYAGHAYRADTEAMAKEALYVTGRAEFAARLDATAAARPGATFFASGSPAFVDATITALVQRGIRHDRIRRDGFSGWSAPALTPAPGPDPNRDLIERKAGLAWA